MKKKKNKVSTSKDASLKGEWNFYALLFVTSQLRDCNMDELFKHEHHNYPPLFRNMELSGKLASQISWIVFKAMVHQC